MPSRSTSCTTTRAGFIDAPGDAGDGSRPSTRPWTVADLIRLL